MPKSERVRAAWVALVLVATGSAGCAAALATPGQGHDAGVVDAGPPPWPSDWAQREDAMLVLVNQLRQTGGDCPSGHRDPAPLLVDEPRLHAIARAQSQDMADHNYFDHTGRDGRDPFQRMADVGYTFTTAGENIAAGNTDAAATFQQWLHSDEHCKNMTDPNYAQSGIGYAEGVGDFHAYWTQDFGHP